ncbi:hypothetical protein C8Q78DRAFT_1000989 [Trametes maxima]|nr:hypothetical protein C8Q78DRAFT_1000989 [Trametes maxima]
MSTDDISEDDFSTDERVELAVILLPHLPKVEIPWEENCPICLNQFYSRLDDPDHADEGGVTQIKECGHFFCRECLAGWIRSNVGRVARCFHQTMCPDESPIRFRNGHAPCAATTSVASDSNHPAQEALIMPVTMHHPSMFITSSPTHILWTRRVGQTSTRLIPWPHTSTKMIFDAALMIMPKARRPCPIPQKAALVDAARRTASSMTSMHMRRRIATIGSRRAVSSPT